MRTFQIITLYIYIISLQCVIDSSILAMTTILPIPTIHFLTLSSKKYTSYTWTNTLIFDTITIICFIHTTFSNDFNHPVNINQIWCPPCAWTIVITGDFNDRISEKLNCQLYILSETLLFCKSVSLLLFVLWIWFHFSFH